LKENLSCRYERRRGSFVRRRAGFVGDVPPGLEVPIRSMIVYEIANIVVRLMDSIPFDAEC
jgi:hypothetical protein